MIPMTFKLVRVFALSRGISQDDKNHSEHFSRPSNQYPKLAAVQKQNSGQGLLNTIATFVAGSPTALPFCLAYQ